MNRCALSRLLNTSVEGLCRVEGPREQVQKAKGLSTILYVRFSYPFTSYIHKVAPPLATVLLLLWGPESN